MPSNESRLEQGYVKKEAMSGRYRPLTPNGDTLPFVSPSSSSSANVQPPRTWLGEEGDRNVSYAYGGTAHAAPTAPEDQYAFSTTLRRGGSEGVLPP